MNQRRTRSTRRLEGMPDLPQQPREDRTVGTVFTAPDGTRFQPSMFVTLTLDSYGKLRPGRGVPVRPDRYDYRRAALDALHFAKLMDRWFQNLRRSAGYRVQYFGAIEAQMRLAPHFHVALRGAIPGPRSRPSPRPPTSRCGGHRLTPSSTSTARRCGTTGTTATPTPATRCPPGSKPSTTSTTRTPSRRM